jgi:CHAT domain-containing protein
VAQAKPAEWMDYGQIPPLPDTRDEILALAKALKADPATDVFLGSQASTANVKKLDLSKRRVVAFATHGLLAGDFPGVAEPSLALANPGGGQHGLLTLEDIMGLKLDADWVVLSACNTAAGDGQGADALSGLGRGFFYAGSRALLVTHWPVESVSARMLVSGIFERQAADGKLSRAEALRQSMLALMQQNSAPAHGFSYAHPLFWAPYALVGEGGI